MDLHSADSHTLEPLSYHAHVVDYFKRHEPDVWAWAGSQKIRDEHVEQVRSHLLRDTYRMDPDSHPDVHTSLALAMQRLGVEVPATLYQAGGQASNAALVFVPGEVHLVLEGQMLERLTESERLAVFGHELAHYVLWSRDGGQFHVADRILNDALASTQCCDSHRETFRLYALHTELFADRGGALAAQALAPVVSTLVKLHTGITNPDPAAYLRQAAEIDARQASASNSVTHPETFIRARALELWWQGSEILDAWIADKLGGALALSSLDLPGQVRLQGITRGFLTHFLGAADLRSELAVNQVRLMFPDWSPDEPALLPTAIRELNPDASVLAYLNALMLDLALVDPDIRDEALVRAGQVARELDSEESLQTHLKRDARLGKRELDKLKKKIEMAVRA